MHGASRDSDSDDSGSNSDEKTRIRGRSNVAMKKNKQEKPTTAVNKTREGRDCFKITSHNVHVHSPTTATQPRSGPGK